MIIFLIIEIMAVIVQNFSILYISCPLPRTPRACGFHLRASYFSVLCRRLCNMLSSLPKKAWSHPPVSSSHINLPHFLPSTHHTRNSLCTVDSCLFPTTSVSDSKGRMFLQQVLYNFCEKQQKALKEIRPCGPQYQNQLTPSKCFSQSVTLFFLRCNHLFAFNLRLHPPAPCLGLTC